MYSIIGFSTPVNTPNVSQSPCTSFLFSLVGWDCTAENNTEVILNKKPKRIGPPYVLSLSHRSAVASAGTDRRWIYLLSCLCMPMSEDQGINNSQGGA